jgi:hypothetical protein
MTIKEILQRIDKIDAAIKSGIDPDKELATLRNDLQAIADEAQMALRTGAELKPGAKPNS